MNQQLIPDVSMRRKYAVSEGQAREAVSRSGSLGMAGNRLGISTAELLDVIRRYKISPSLLGCLGKNGVHRKPIPAIIIKNETDRTYIGALIGTEGAITCRYEKSQRKTALVVVVEMTDREYIAKLADIVGLSEPMTFGRFTRAGHKPKFRRTLMGLRALKVLQEVLPLMYGSRRADAIRAIEAFSPTGYKEGYVTPHEIWGALREPVTATVAIQTSNSGEIN
jgi:hypothetical protein